MAMLNGQLLRASLLNYTGSRTIGLAVALFLFVVYLLLSSGGDSSPAAVNYAVIVDAGSSGSRVFVYRWQKPKILSNPLLVSQHFVDGFPITKRSEPGLSFYADNPEGAFDSLHPGITYAAASIPAEFHHETPVFVLGTAGLRAIDQKARTKIFDAVRKGIAYNFPFRLGNVEAISGEREAVYAWVTANYVLQSLNKNTKTTGIADLGGGSMQIAFEAPRSGPWKDSVETIRMGSNNYDVFRVSHSGYGVQAAHKKYNAELSKGGEGKPDPCLPKGSKERFEGKDVIGAGDFQECKRKVRKMMLSVRACKADSCVFNEKAHPPIEDDREFIGFSEYWYGTHDVMGLGGRLSVEKLYTASQAYCGKSMDDIIAYGKTTGYPGFPKDKTPEKDFWLRRQCFKSAYIPATLETAWGFPSFPANFASHHKVNGEELQWTLGALVLLLEDDSGGASTWLWIFVGVGLLGAAFVFIQQRWSTKQLLTQRYTLPSDRRHNIFG